MYRLAVIFGIIMHRNIVRDCRFIKILLSAIKDLVCFLNTPPLPGF